MSGGGFQVQRVALSITRFLSRGNSFDHIYILDTDENQTEI